MARVLIIPYGLGIGLPVHRSTREDVQRTRASYRAFGKFLEDLANSLRKKKFHCDFEADNLSEHAILMIPGDPDHSEVQRPFVKRVCEENIFIEFSWAFPTGMTFIPHGFDTLVMRDWKRDDRPFLYTERDLVMPIDATDLSNFTIQSWLRRMDAKYDAVVLFGWPSLQHPHLNPKNIEWWSAVAKYMREHSSYNTFYYIFDIEKLVEIEIVASLDEIQRPSYGTFDIPSFVSTPPWHFVNVLKT